MTSPVPTSSIGARKKMPGYLVTPIASVYMDTQLFGSTGECHQNQNFLCFAGLASSDVEIDQFLGAALPKQGGGGGIRRLNPKNKISNIQQNSAYQKQFIRENIMNKMFYEPAESEWGVQSAVMDKSNVEF